MIRGDSSEYELLKKWCETLPFYEKPKSVTTCEVGVREGLGSQIIMMSVASRIGKSEYQHYAIDPYGDLEYMDIFNLSKTIYDFVFLDGPHTTKDILREALWFAERSRKGTRIVIDDYRLCNFEVIRTAISYWDFIIHEQGKNKVCLQKK